ncbi:J domain-containing protein [Sphingomicrobium flavum]|uniref:J domain-containing protein n=1 Tax=Sphingomicrobium flavum TaxID=1229164 RepID=UPI0021ADF80A|nr:J domain-containing protein [Sphingomicrobium flavum]
METNLYALLGLAPGASPADIRRAYRDLMREHHPDSGKAADGGDLAARINVAYDTLSDPYRRSAYDRTLKSTIERAGGRVPDVRVQDHETKVRPVRTAEPNYLRPAALFWLFILSLFLFSPFIYAFWWSLP